MSRFLGIDPGVKGGIAIYDKDTNSLGPVWDMPMFLQTIGRSKKPRVDVPALASILAFCKDMQVELAVLEEVGGLPRQSASSSFTFGWSCGVVYMGLVQNCIAVDPVRPSVWKKILKCGKEDSEILHRAQQMFPGNEALWRGPKGGLKDGRCEAAMLAYFGAYHAFGRTQEGAERRILTL